MNIATVHREAHIGLVAEITTLSGEVVRVAVVTKSRNGGARANRMRLEFAVPPGVRVDFIREGEAPDPGPRPDGVRMAGPVIYGHIGGGS